MKRKTQKQLVLDWLLSVGSVTRLTAFTELGVAELSSRIGELEADGYEIPRKRIKVTARNNRQCYVMQYYAPIKKPRRAA